MEPRVVADLLFCDSSYDEGRPGVRGIFCRYQIDTKPPEDAVYAKQYKNTTINPDFS